MLFEDDDAQRAARAPLRHLPGDGAAYDSRADDADVICVHPARSSGQRKRSSKRRVERRDISRSFLGEQQSSA